LECVADINIQKNKRKTDIFFAVLDVGHNWSSGGRISEEKGKCSLHPTLLNLHPI